MMPEIALNILDVAENSIRAGASLVTIEVRIYRAKDLLSVRIKDDGCGMDEEQVRRVQDPFFTTRTTRKVGFGVPFFQQAAESTGGSFEILSEKGKGTEVNAVFRLSHIDRMPLGDINAVIYTLLTFNESVEFHYSYEFDEKSFELDSRDVKEILGNMPLNVPEVSTFIKEYLKENKLETDHGIDV